MLSAIQKSKQRGLSRLIYALGIRHVGEKAAYVLAQKFRTIDNLIEARLEDFDAIYEACLVRFRPITMTGLAAIMGAVPIALGFGADGASRRPLGLIVVGGLIFSQVITLYVTPGLFLYMQKFQSKVLDKFELTRSEAARKTAELTSHENS